MMQYLIHGDVHTLSLFGWQYMYIPDRFHTTPKAPSCLLKYPNHSRTRSRPHQNNGGDIVVLFCSMFHRSFGDHKEPHPRKPHQLHILIYHYFIPEQQHKRSRHIKGIVTTLVYQTSCLKQTSGFRIMHQNSKNNKTYQRSRQNRHR
jgi:hypothetical protein